MKQKIESVTLEDGKEVLQDYLGSDSEIQVNKPVSDYGIEALDVLALIHKLRTRRGLGSFLFNKDAPYSTNEFAGRLTLFHLVTIANYEPSPNNL